MMKQIAHFANGDRNEMARKLADWPEAVRERRKAVNNLAYLAETVRRAYNAVKDVTYIPA